jgi:hypothetical protein
MARLRKFLRGCGANVRGEVRRKKTELSQEINRLDDLAEQGGLDKDGWAKRYQLEEELTMFCRQEEMYWQSRGMTRWLLEGDSNTGYFHNIANGRRRKCTIGFLDSDRGRITVHEDLVAHIYEFYRGLFGQDEREKVRMALDLWQRGGG